MPDFRYTAREASGKQITGVLSAGSENEVALTLSSQQLFPIDIKPAQKAGAAWQRPGGRIAAKQVAAFFAQLSDLLKAGVPLLRSLELLERQTSTPAFTSVLKEIRQDVSEGTPLADAMKKHPQAFTTLAISIVHAGEEGGFLEDVLRRIAIFTEHQEELKGRVFGAIAYPAFLLTFGSLVVMVLIVWFVPQFEPIFARLEAEQGLPTATVVLLTISDILSGYWWLLLGLLVAAVLGMVRAVQSERGRLVLDRWRIKVPGAGPIYRSLAISRFCRILGTLLANGVPILPSLKTAKDATGNVILQEAIGDAAENISQGDSLADPLSASGHFPVEIVEMIAVGEEANNLENVLVDIADSLEKRTWRQLDLVVKLIEPIMLLGLAGSILFVVIALLLPVFQSSSTL